MTDAIEMSNIDLIDGLRRFQDAFNRDFSFRDVLPELKKYISKVQLIELLNITDEKERISKLFFIFIYNKRDVWPLIDCIKKSYQWLYKSILTSKGDKWIADYRSAIQDIPNNQDWNIHRTIYLWEIQEKLKTLQRNNYLILFGKLGFGKRWLAADACRDYGVISRMNSKIYWLNVSKCCTQELVLEKMHRLKVLLQADDLDIKYNTYSGNTKNEIIHMRGYLRKILEQPEFKQCLIVLTDVQDENILKAFDLNCKIFCTTRHIEKFEFIPKEQKTHIDIDKGFEREESLELFTKAFSSQLPIWVQEYVEKFHKICNGHPFIMSLIARTFQNFQKESEKDRRVRCERWLRNLEEYRLNEQNTQIKMSVEESLKFLEIDLQICYKKMVIFTDNSDIPLQVLEKIWDKDPQQTEFIVLRFHKYSLIEKPSSDENDKACSLHYLHYHFLKQHVPDENQKEYHRHLIKQYQVERTIRERRELDLNFPNDNYFHYFIPYHLLGAEREDLFDLYLDFGFLEQKMRLTKLPNTVGDLIKYESEITRNSPERVALFLELVDFLTNSEQLLFKSADVNLLQLALTSSGSVQKEAQKQIERFHDRVWMNDVNHGENQTQIVQLSGGTHPQLVRFVKPNDNLVCLISLQDNNILLHDISQDYPDDTVLYKSELAHSTVTDMQVYRHQAFLTLNDVGKLSVYTLKSTPMRRPSGPSRALTAKTIESQSNKLLQKLENGNDKITCFNVFEASTTGVDLIVGTIKGFIKFYQWNVNKFEDKKIVINTDFKDLFRMAHVDNEYVMLLNTKGDIRFVNLIDSSLMFSSQPWSKLESPINLHHGFCAHLKKPISICVSRDKVVQVIHASQQKNLVFVQYDEVFVATDEFDDNKILSSTMSKDADYLILGTQKGIIVIDRFDKRVIFRRNVSDQVLSLDIYRYHDEAMYILSSVFKDAEQVISLYGFNGNRDELAMMSNEMNFFLGEDLFDIKKSSEDWQMVAVDTKRNIHFRSSADDFVESFSKVAFKFQIKKIFLKGEEVILGCTNGEVYAIDQFKQPNLLMTLTSEITYLECFDDVIVASCNSLYKLGGVEREFYGKVAKAYRYTENQLLLIKKNCSIEIIDSKTGGMSFSKVLADDMTVSAQAYCDGLVVIGTIDRFIHIWNISEDPEEPFDKKMIETDCVAESLAVSYDKNILAIGCQNGTIEIVNLVDMNPLKKLESHKRSIKSLVFSPWTGPNDPLILLSLSESVIFWNVRSILNNPLELTKKETSARLRVSQRFKSPLKIAPTNGNSLLAATENLSMNASNPWRRKTGSSDKPELLSCIKLVAKSAKRIICNDEFTRFATVDNEGNIYHLRMICDDDDEYQSAIDFNGNPLRLIK